MSEGVRSGHSLAFASSDVDAAMWLHRPLTSCRQQCRQVQTCPVQGQQVARSNAVGAVRFLLALQGKQGGVTSFWLEDRREWWCMEGIQVGDLSLTALGCFVIAGVIRQIISNSLGGKHFSISVFFSKAHRML